MRVFICKISIQGSYILHFLVSDYVRLTNKSTLSYDVILFEENEVKISNYWTPLSRFTPNIIWMLFAISICRDLIFGLSPPATRPASILYILSFYSPLTETWLCMMEGKLGTEAMGDILYYTHQIELIWRNIISDFISIYFLSLEDLRDRAASESSSSWKVLRGIECFKN